MKQSRWVIDSCAGAPLFSLTVSWLQGSLLHGCNCTDCERQCNYTSAHCPTKSSPQCAPHLSPWLHWEAHRAHWLQFSCDLCTLHKCTVTHMCTVHSDPPVHRYHSDPPMLNQRRYYTRTLHCLPVKLLYVCVNNCALQYWYDSTYSFTVHTVLLYIQFYCPYRFTVHTVLLCSGIINPVYCERWPWQCYTHAGLIDSSLLYTLSSWLNKLILLLLIRIPLFWLCITTICHSSTVHWSIHRDSALEDWLIDSAVGFTCASSMCTWFTCADLVNCKFHPTGKAQVLHNIYYHTLGNIILAQHLLYHSRGTLRSD